MANTDKFYLACEYIKNRLKLDAPKDTWNMANSIVIKRESNNSYVITVGNELADYAVYTNEPWISDKWKGKQNPNERWIQRSIENASSVVMQIMSGKLKSSEVLQMLKNQESEYLNTAKELAAKYREEGDKL